MSSVFDRWSINDSTSARARGTNPFTGVDRLQGDRAALVFIARALEADGIDTTVLKGAHLAAAIYANLALREMADVDVLARRNT